VIPLSLALAAVALLAQTRTATVLSIGDGDTLCVRDGSHTLNVRLACIDAPEANLAQHCAGLLDSGQGRLCLQALP